MNRILENQQWRYATKRFDASRKISGDDLDTLKEAIRLSPSSYGLQPYKVLIIEDAEVREKLKSAAWNQTQITDASHLIVFANETQFGDTHIDRYISNISKTREIATESLAGFESMMKSKITTLEESQKDIWSSKQAYLALGNLINAAAELRIDVTPMEGFEAGAFNEILGLPQQGLNAAVIAAIGYRHTEDASQHYKKVRKTTEELFINL